MSGLIKPKNYDWKDSNLAFLGSEIEKNVKKKSAAEEPAWKDAGTKAGLQIWRIVNLKVDVWRQSDYGKFYNGDSYIILNTYSSSPTSKDMSYDAHFWIGSRSTQDEYGTAAYKTVELDTHLDGKSIQHREVEGFESELFRSYFPKGITIMDGGAESGFNPVRPKEYHPRLFHFCRKDKSVAVTEVPKSKERVVSDDVLILDLGLTIYQWNGSGSNKDERFRAMQYMNELKSDRGGRAVTEVLEEADTFMDHHFYSALTEENIKDEIATKCMTQLLNTVPVNQLYKLGADSSKSMDFAKVKEGTVSKKDFDSQGIYLLDNGRECFVWIGNQTSAQIQNGFGLAHCLLMKSSHPLVPVSILKEGQTSKTFEMALAA